MSIVLSDGQQGRVCMAELIDKGMLLCFGLYLAAWQGGEQAPVIAFLAAAAIAAWDCYVTEKRKKVGGIFVFLLLCFFVPQLYLFLPVAFYDCVRTRFGGGAVGVLFIFWHKQEIWGLPMALLFLTLAGAVLLAYRTDRMEELEKKLIRLRDTSTELAIALKEKNRTLIEKQDNEIYTATLKERNRIAREIHDNVGHMLSRSILQVGALLAVYRDEQLKEQLGSVRETLGLAMNNIRESVHDLHDDSVDLNQAVLEVLGPIRADYEVIYRYDMGKNIPRNVKYCFLSAVKEAISNTMRHSDADRIEIVMVEHPVIFQLKIEDNGTTGESDAFQKAGGELLDGSGMGLSNMRTRVEGMHGTFHVSRDGGFRIFIAVPKEDGKGRGL